MQDFDRFKRLSDPDWARDVGEFVEFVKWF